MKKIIWIALILCFAVVGLFACAKKEKNPRPDPATCTHEDALTSFITNRTETPFAAEYTCSICDRKITKSFGYEEIEIPLVEIEGDLDGISKTDKVQAVIRYQSEELSFEKNATLKWQGDTSLEYPKKNYSVAMYDEEFNKKEKIVVKEEWGAQSKYCLKANYLDPLGSRNLVLSDLYGEVAETRTVNDAFSNLPNGGSVDGFLILLYHNGQYVGLYNWNIPKDKWLFGMGSDEDAGEAVLCGESTLLNEDTGITLNEAKKYYWEVEYCNENYENTGDASWAEISFNKMLTYVKTTDPRVLKRHASEFLDMDRVIDVLLMTSVFAPDNIYKNLVWCTYDGVIWAPVLYDLDRTFGRDGSKLNGGLYFENFTDNPLYRILFITFYEELSARYKALRKDLLTKDHILSLFSEKMKGVDERYFRSEFEKWEEAGWRKTLDQLPIDSFSSELSYVGEWLETRLTFCDSIFSRDAVSLNEDEIIVWE